MEHTGSTGHKEKVKDKVKQAPQGSMAGVVSVPERASGDWEFSVPERTSRDWECGTKSVSATVIIRIVLRAKAGRPQVLVVIARVI